MMGSIRVAEQPKSWKAVKWAGKLRPGRWGMWLFNHLLVVILSYIKEDLNVSGCLWSMGLPSIWTIKTKDVGREWLTGLAPATVPWSVEAAHPQLPRVSCNCVNRSVAFLFIWRLLWKKRLNPGSHKVIRQLRRNWFYPTKEVPASLTESRSNDWRRLQQIPLGQSRSKMDTLLLLGLNPQLTADLTFSACDMLEDAGHSNLNWCGGCSINKTK